MNVFKKKIKNVDKIKNVKKRKNVTGIKNVKNVFFTSMLLGDVTLSSMIFRLGRIQFV